MALNTSFSQHGHFSLGARGQVVFISMVGTWNEECVASFEQAFPAFLQSEKVSGAWGALTDLREWEGATPQALERIAGNVPWLHGLGMAASARIVTEVFYNAMIDKVVEVNSPYQVFNNPEQGLAWLATLGFTQND